MDRAASATGTPPLSCGIRLTTGGGAVAAGKGSRFGATPPPIDVGHLAG